MTHDFSALQSELNRKDDEIIRLQSELNKERLRTLGMAGELANRKLRLDDCHQKIEELTTELNYTRRQLTKLEQRLNEQTN